MQTGEIVVLKVRLDGNSHFVYHEQGILDALYGRPRIVRLMGTGLHDNYLMLIVEYVHGKAETFPSLPSMGYLRRYMYQLLQVVCGTNPFFSSLLLLLLSLTPCRLSKRHCTNVRRNASYTMTSSLRISSIHRMCV